MKRMIDIFSTLGDRLSHFGKDSTSQEVMRRAMEENHWFSQSDILMAIEAIREEFLDHDKLQKWAAAYTMTEPRRVAIIMAGNIPLVGFYDPPPSIGSSCNQQRTPKTPIPLLVP